MPKKRSAPDQEAARAAPSLRYELSPTFRASDADCEIRSSDGVRFLLHKANLIASSQVFADMLSLASDESTSLREDGRAVIEVTEPPEVLHRMFPYFYPKSVPGWVLELPGDLIYFSAFDKYEVWRGIDAVEAALHYLTKGNEDDGLLGPASLDEIVVTFAFATHFSRPALQLVARKGAIEAAAKEDRPAAALLRIDWGSLCSPYVKQELSLTITSRLLTIPRMHTSLDTAFHDKVAAHCAISNCNGVEVFDAWRRLLRYGTASGLNSALFDDTPCQACNTIYRASLYALTSRVAPLECLADEQ